jgi:RNA-directed DNA polymerase
VFRSLSIVITDCVLNEAFSWLCQRRIDYSPHDTVWGLRANWQQHKADILSKLNSGQYRLSPQNRIKLSNGETIDIWTAQDALVLKALTITLSDLLPVSSDCTHIKGHGGLKRAVRDVHQNLPDNGFVLRTDVKSYYASIDHIELLDRLAVYIKDKNILNLVSQYLKRSTEYGGTFKDFDQGISRGCPLSPLMAAFYLHELDVALAKEPVFYIRYMDDILILAKTRHKLRRAIASVNSVLSSLKLIKHPDKTTMGHICRGFDFLGYHFTHIGAVAGLSPARQTLQNYQTKLSRLYEQNGTVQRKNWGWSPTKRKPQTVEMKITTYKKRWLSWVTGGLQNVSLDINLYGACDDRMPLAR